MNTVFRYMKSVVLEFYFSFATRIVCGKEDG